MDIKILELAAKAMKITTDAAAEHCKEAPEIGGWYFWNPVRGGISVLINAAGERLAASSGVNYDQHLKAFKNGRRN